MFLTEANVLHYLLQRRFADLASVVDGAYHVCNLSRRNRNFRVTCGRREYLVKQPKKWNAPARKTIDREAAVYWRAKSDPRLEPVRALVPESYGYDPENSVLILEYLAEQRSLRQSRERFSPDVARLVGSVMAKFHRGMQEVSNRELFPARKPWYLAMHQVDAEQRMEDTKGQREVVRTVQKHRDFGPALDALRAEWREETVFHGDWKLDNCLLSTTGARCHVIDWEMASWGDAFEDAGTLLQSYWNYWVRRPSEYSIGEIRPALRAFVEAYAEGSGGRTPAAVAARAVRFAAARMLQSAYEAVQDAEELNSDAVCLLQAGLNILTRPKWAMGEIFGPGWN